MLTHQSTSALIADDRQQLPDFCVKPNRIPAAAIVRRRNDRPQPGGYGPPGVDRDAGLIGEADHDSRDAVAPRSPQTDVE